MQTRQTLIERLRDQYDEDSWQVFIQTYQRYIYVVIRGMNINHSEAEDLVQEVLFQLWNKLPEFNYNPDKAKFRTWLCTVIKNRVLNYIKAKESQLNRIDKASQQPVKGYSDHEMDAIMQKEWEVYITNMALERIKSSFPGQAIKVFEMTLEGKSIAEIASALDIKENSVYEHNRNILRKGREWWGSFRTAADVAFYMHKIHLL